MCYTPSDEYLVRGHDPYVVAWYSMGSPALADGHVYFASHNGKVYCFGSSYTTDSDGDGIFDYQDNCPDVSNPLQEDTYPPGGNMCGDASECEGDFEHDGDVDGTDAYNFKLDFGRRDCSEQAPCNGNFDCADGNVDGSDAYMFKVDFGRRDCPICAFSCY